MIFLQFLIRIALNNWRKYEKIYWFICSCYFRSVNVFTGCQNDSDSNSALLLGLSGVASGAETEDLSKNSVVASLYLNSSTTKEVSLEGFSFDSDTALTVSHQMTVKKVNLGGGSITVNASGVTLEEVTNGTIFVNGYAVLKNCNVDTVVAGSISARTAILEKLEIKNGSIKSLVFGDSFDSAVLYGDAKVDSIAVVGNISVAVKVGDKDVQIGKASVVPVIAEASDLPDNEQLNISDDAFEAIKSNAATISSEELDTIAANAYATVEKNAAAIIKFDEGNSAIISENAIKAYKAAESDIVNAKSTEGGLKCGDKEYKLYELEVLLKAIENKRPHQEDLPKNISTALLYYVNDIELAEFNKICTNLLVLMKGDGEIPENWKILLGVADSSVKYILTVVATEAEQQLSEPDSYGIYRVSRTVSGAAKAIQEYMDDGSVKFYSDDTFTTTISVPDLTTIKVGDVFYMIATYDDGTC